MMQAIPLTKGYYALVSDQDYPTLSAFSWCVFESHGKIYASRGVWLGKGRQSVELMHRRILDAPIGIKVDHRDGDGLNNQRFNLRLASDTQNSANRRKQDGTSSPFKGVCWHRRDQRWTASIQVRGRRHHLGNFGDPEEAARAYDRAALVHFGDFALINFSSGHAI